MRFTQLVMAATFGGETPAFPRDEAGNIQDLDQVVDWVLQSGRKMSLHHKVSMLRQMCTRSSYESHEVECRLRLRLNMASTSPDEIPAINSLIGRMKSEQIKLAGLQEQLTQLLLQHDQGSLPTTPVEVGPAGELGEFGERAKGFFGPPPFTDRAADFFSISPARGEPTMKLWQAESLREIISTNISDEFDRLAALSYVDREIEILERRSNQLATSLALPGAD